MFNSEYILKEKVKELYNEKHIKHLENIQNSSFAETRLSIFCVIRTQHLSLMPGAPVVGQLEPVKGYRRLTAPPDRL